MALALLKRSDTDLILPVACDSPERLATELSALQPFSVEVVAAWAGCAGKLPLIQNALWSRLVRNSWFSVAAEEAEQLMSKACEQEKDTRTLEKCDAQLPPRVWIDPLWHAYLEECPRATADKATAIRKALKKVLGPIEAAALLSQYKECALRVATGGCQRFIVNDKGVTMKFAHKAVAI